MKKLVALCFAVMLIALMSGCGNTFNGAGKDMEGWGRWMQDTF